MKRIVLAFGLVIAAVPAMAETASQPQYTPTTAVLLDQALRCESVASQQIAALQQQLDAVTKERDALKAAAAQKPTETKQ